MSTHVTVDGYPFVVDDCDDHLVVGMHCKTKKCKDSEIRYVIVSGDYRLHRLIAGVNGFDVDHKDGNTLNNRRSNLRTATESQNMANAKLRKDSRAGLKGVQAHGPSWRARLRVNGKIFRFGCYSTPQEAALAYDAAAIKHFGEFARTNKMLGLV